MSEQQMGQEVVSPKDRAVQYLAMRQGKMFKDIGQAEKKIKTGVFSPVPKVERTTPLVDTVTAYEKVIDAMGRKGYEGLQQKLADMRPAVYDGLRAVQWGARAADYLLTAAIWFPVNSILMRKNVPAAPPVPGKLGLGMGELKLVKAMREHRLLSTFGMMRLRPLEWATAQVVKIGGAVASSDAVAPVVNSILGGGERVIKTPDVTPNSPPAA